MAAAASSSFDTTNDGPVLSLINKRLRALRKKLNRITQMEESLSQGKTLNKEQDETLRSKSSVLASIDELEKLRQPLSEAVFQEISLALEKLPKPETKESHDEQVQETDVKGENGGVSAISDLLNLLYFGSVFDVKTLMRAHENMITRTHERSSCLTYDYVTDDDAAGDPLKEWDLDLISMLGGLLISRPLDSSLPHKNALEKCVEHARLWLANSEQPINPNSDVTYAGLREKLDKIMASEYFTTTPAIKAPVEVAAAAAGNYTSYQVPVHGSVIPAGVIVPVEDLASEYQPPEEESPNSSHGNEIYDDKTDPSEEIHKGGSEIEDGSEVQVQTDVATPDTEVDQNSRDLDLNEQQYATRRPPQNYRGGRGGGGGGRRGYLNGRGGRGNGRGGYQNGRSQFYDQPSNYYPRNNYNYRGRGGRGGMGANYNHHATADLASHVEAAS